jgi:hypothetical protein
MNWSAGALPAHWWCAVDRCGPHYRQEPQYESNHECERLGAAGDHGGCRRRGGCRACARRSRHRFRQRTPHVWHLRAKDYNAWIAKITCKRLYNGLDQDAEKSAKFVFTQLPKGSTTEQAWQFLGAAINTYCPEQAPVLQRAAGQG